MILGIILLQLLKVALSQKVFQIWLKSPKKGAKSQTWALSTYREDAQGLDFAPLIGDLSQSQNTFWNNAPLARIIYKPAFLGWKRY